MNKQKKNQKPAKTAKKKNGRRKVEQSTATTYRISIIRYNDFTIENAENWMKHNCNSKHWHREYKKNVVFSFNEINDAFKFKLYFERA